MMDGPKGLGTGQVVGGGHRGGCVAALDSHFRDRSGADRIRNRTGPQNFYLKDRRRIQEQNGNE
jgi:hypothetical protein